MLKFAAAVAKLEADRSPFAAVLADQRDLFALWWIQERLGEFYESGYLSSAAQAESIREGVRARLASIRPNAVALCDAWGHTDFALNSALGRYDGQYINALWTAAQGDVNPMNRDVVDPSFEESLKAMRVARL